MGGAKGGRGSEPHLFLLLGCDWRTDSSRKRREALAAAATAHVVTCEGVRRERAAAAAVSPRRAWRSVSLSELLGAVSPPGVSARLCPRVSGSPRSLGGAARSSSPPWTDRLFLPLDRFPPPRPRGAFRWACSRPLPAAPRRSSRDEFFHLFRDEPDYDA